MLVFFWEIDDYPFSEAVSLAFQKLSLVRAAVFPNVFAGAFEFSLTVIADVKVTVGEFLCSVAVFEATGPFSFVLVLELGLVFMMQVHLDPSRRGFWRIDLLQLAQRRRWQRARRRHQNTFNLFQRR